MKVFLAIVDVTPDNRVAKYQDFDTLLETETHVTSVLMNFPKAFAIANPGGAFSDWLIDMTTKTIVLVSPPDTTPTARQRIIDRLRKDPILKAQVIDSFEARGITDKQVMLTALEAKFADTI